MAAVIGRLLAAGRWLGTGTLAAVALGLAGCIAVLTWARQTVPAEAGARFALDSDEAVIVSRGDWITFRPRDADPAIGVVFYPAARAEPVAYAPMLHDMAARGYLVVLCPMPLNLALLAPECASGVAGRFREVRRWVLAGHGLGGAMAAEFVERHPRGVAGLVLWAADPAWFTDLSGRELPVLAVHGAAEAHPAAAERERARGRLPPQAAHVTLPGIGRWGFGAFHPGEGDARRAGLLDATCSFLQTVTPADAGPLREAA